MYTITVFTLKSGKDSIASIIYNAMQFHSSSTIYSASIFLIKSRELHVVNTVLYKFCYFVSYKLHSGDKYFYCAKSAIV